MRKRIGVIRKQIVLTLFVAILFCQPPNYENICDPESKAFLQTYILKIFLNDKTSHCGIGNGLQNSTSSTLISISGTVTNLISSGLVLQNNGADDQSIAYAVKSFSFPTKVNSYNVTIKTQPAQLNCTVNNGTGNSSTDVTNISVVCLPKTLSFTGIVSTFVGNGTGAFLDGTGTGAQVFQAHGVVSDPSGTNLYIADSANHRIRKVVIATGVVTTIAGNGTGTSVDGTGTAAQFNAPQGITTDGTNVYISDVSGHKVRKLEIANNVVTTIAGNGTPAFLDGIGTAAQVNQPRGLATDGTYIYLADSFNHRIRKIEIATNTISTIAGDGTAAYLDGTGTGAQFNQPQGIATDGTNLYIGDTQNNKLRKIIIATGVVTTLVLGLTGPYGIVIDSDNLYIANSSVNCTISKYSFSATSNTTFAGSSCSFSDGALLSAQLNAPIHMTTDGTSIFFGDYSNNRIRRIQ